MRGEAIRERLHSGDRVYGTHVCSLTNPVAAKIQASLPYDFAFTCNEHMPIDRTETAMLCQYYAACGISPIVRITHPDPAEAATALDGGAQGIVAPYVETVDEVRAMVGAVKYRPIKGERLNQYLDGATPTDDVQAFLNRFNRDSYLIIGIESQPAYDRLDDLIGIPGVDGVFVGPHDMTASMGIPEQYSHPDFMDMVHDIIARCRAASIGVGIHFSQASLNDEGFLDLIQRGMNWVLYGADLALMRTRMAESLTLFRDEMGDEYVRHQEASGDAANCLGM